MTTDSLADFYLPHIPSTEPWRRNDYGSARSQRRRFKVVTDELGIRDGDRVLDVGCGTAEYAVWLHEHGYDVSYAGADALDEMLAAAAENLTGLDRKTERLTKLDVFKEALPGCEFAVCLGVLGVLPGSAVERRLSVDALLTNLDGCSERGFAFTALTGRGVAPVDPTGMRWYADLGWLMQTVDERFADRPIRVVADYHPYDVMFVVRKSGF